MHAKIRTKQTQCAKKPVLPLSQAHKVFSMSLFKSETSRLGLLAGHYAEIWGISNLEKMDHISVAIIFHI